MPGAYCKEPIIDKMNLKPNRVPYNIPMPNNMGVVRYLLAISVVIAHFNILAGGDVPILFTSYSAVGGFFTLSGFLIYGSYLKRGDTYRYIRSRMIRLLPAYWATVLIFAAALVGVSTMSASGYFTSPQFWKYLAANMAFMNFLEPDLPGVFQSQAISAVNVSLWTMKVEWMLYLSVPAVVWLIRKTKFKALYVLICIYIFSICYRLCFHWLHAATGNELYNILGRQFIGQLMYFYIGVLIYYYLDAFLRHKWIILSMAVCLSLCSDWIPYFNIIVHPLSFGSLVVWLSMVGKWGTFEGRKDNVSYNMYLVHAPIIQLVAVSGLMGRVGMWTSFMMAMIAIVFLSVAINVAVEKPIQRRFTKGRL